MLAERTKIYSLVSECISPILSGGVHWQYTRTNEGAWKDYLVLNVDWVKELRDTDGTNIYVFTVLTTGYVNSLMAGSAIEDAIIGIFEGKDYLISAASKIIDSEVISHKTEDEGDRWHDGSVIYSSVVLSELKICISN